MSQFSSFIFFFKQISVQSENRKKELNPNGI